MFTDPVRSVYPKYQLVNVNMNAQFICVSSKKVKWLFGEKQVEDGFRTQHINFVYKLKISLVQKYNQGKYFCSGKSVETGEDFIQWGKLIVQDKENGICLVLLNFFFINIL